MIKKDQYAIVGLGVTKHGKVPGITSRKFHAEACRLAIEDAGLKREDIGGYIYQQYATGAAEDAPPRMLGLPLNFYWLLESGGASTISGLAAAMGAIECGLANYVCVVIGDDALSGRDSPLLPPKKTWEYSAADVDRTVLTCYGLAGGASRHSPMATEHMARYGTTSRQLGAISVQERQWANMNPEAYFYDKPITIEDHDNSPVISYPLKRLDCAIVTDGGACFIVTTAERARNLKRPPVYIKGIGLGHHLKMIAQGRNRDTYTESDAITAKKQAFGMAGCELKDIDVAQIYDAFTVVALLQFEDYGFCKKGEGGPWAEAGNIGPGAKIPINTSGGLLGWAYMVGWTPMVEAIRQARGECGARQVKNVELSMATGFASYRPMSYGHGSPRVCSQACVILGR